MLEPALQSYTIYSKSLPLQSLTLKVPPPSPPPSFARFCDTRISSNNIILNFKQERWKVFTSTTASRLRDLCREVQLSMCGRPRNHAIVQIRPRVRNNGNMNLNLAAIRIMGLIAHKSKVSFRCKVIVYYIYIYIKYF